MQAITRNDVLVYDFYICRPSTNVLGTVPVDDFTFVQSRSNQFLAIAQELTQHFLWHRDSFFVSISPNKCSQPQYFSHYLTGHATVGDAVLDEWVIVLICFEISRRFPDVVVEVSHSDGQLLLIECAEVLPEWITPENSEHRVFVADGLIHIVSLNESPNITSGLLLYNALAMMITQDRATYRASDAVQQAIQRKFSELPSYLTHENRHGITVWLPQCARQVVRLCPNVVGAAVEAFHYREPKAAANVCAKMRNFPLQNISQFRVDFTRCGYAQIKQQSFSPPKLFVSHVSGIWRYGGQPHQHDNIPLEADIGLKLVCGLEILASSEMSTQFGTLWKDKIAEALKSDAMDDENSPNIPDDNDSWLNISPMNLDAALERHLYGKERLFDPYNKAPGSELDSISDMFQNFMSSVSSVDGVDSIPNNFDDYEEYYDKDFESDDYQESEPRSVGLDLNSLMMLLSKDSNISDQTAKLSHAKNNSIDQVMTEMDMELESSTMGKSFSHSKSFEFDNSKDSNDTIEDSNVDSLDLNFNLLSNLLESVVSQEGQAGPVTNMLHEMSISGHKKP